MNLSLLHELVRDNIRVLLPEILLLAAAIAMMTASPFVKWPRRVWCSLAVAATVLSFLILWGDVSVHPEASSAVAQETNIERIHLDPYASPAVNDSLAFYGRLFILLTGVLLLAMAHEEPSDSVSGEFFGSLLMINAGAMLVAGANEIIFLFIGLELVSIPTYLLLYLTKRTVTTQETATKYFYLSIFSSGLLLYGLAFLYGTTGISNFKAIAQLSTYLALPDPRLGLIAVVFVMAGLCFRVAAVPFHFYAPDVYEGSPTIVAAMLSWIPKGVGFVAMIRALTAILSVKGPDDPLVQKAIWLCWIIAVTTMVLGNAVALLQTNLKRLLAYSSIAHAGYLMIGITTAFANGPGSGAIYYGSEGIFFYLVAYALMTLGTFGAIIGLKTKGRPVETIDDLKGLAYKQPMAALALVICLLSLSGIPPLIGFWGKFQIFVAAFAATPEGGYGPLFSLAIIGVLNAAVGAYYYLRIVVAITLGSSTKPVETTGSWPVALAVGTCATLTLVLGLYTAPIARACRAASLDAEGYVAPKQAVAVVTERP